MATSPSSALYKQTGENKASAVFLTPAQYSGNIGSISLVGPNGQPIEQLKYRHPYSDGRGIYDFAKPGASYPAGSRVVLTMDNGSTVSYTLDNPALRGENLQGSTTGDVPTGGAAGAAGAMPYGAQGGGQSGYAALPYYLGGQFPTFQPIEQPDYNFTDVVDFSKQFQGQNIGQYLANFQTGKQFALEALQTELQGLQAYAPAAAALKREQISIDNQFNQAQRLAQVRGTLPTAEGDLEAQRQRGLAYAQGRLPDQNLDRALELGIRGRSADAATFAGLGARSAQAQKMSDVMSAEERFKIAQYGEQLSQANLETRANLFLAPTEYSNVGQEIRAVPEVGAGRLASQFTESLNQQTMLTPAQALSAQIDQNKFLSELQFRTDTFNAENSYAAQMGAFNYDVSYLNALQTASQANINAATAMEMQQQQMNAFNKYQSQAATQSAIATGIGAIGSAPTLIKGATSIWNAATGIYDWLTGDSGVTSVEPTTTGSFEAAPVDYAGESGAAIDTSLADVSQFSFSPDIVSADTSMPDGLRVLRTASLPSSVVKVADNPDNTISVVPRQSYASDIIRFAESNGVPQTEVNLRSLAMADRTFASSTGVSFVPTPQTKMVGLSSSGRRLYATPTVATNGNIQTGTTQMAPIVQSLGLLGVASREDVASAEAIARSSADPETIATLDALKNKGQDATVIQKLRDYITQGRSTKLSDYDKALTDRIADTWSSLSPGQKSSAIASLIPSNLRSRGVDTANAVVPGSWRSVTGPLKAVDVMSIEAKGGNGLGLAYRWEQVSNIVNMGTQGKAKTPEQIAAIGQSSGLVGFGPQGASIPVDVNYLKKVDAKAAPAFGVGALAFDNAALVPKGYKTISTTPDGKAIAIPRNAITTSTLGRGSDPAMFVKARDIAAGRHKSQQAWTPVQNRGLKGSLGGSSLVSSLLAMRQSNPKVLAATVAHSLFSNLV